MNFESFISDLIVAAISIVLPVLLIGLPKLNHEENKSCCRDWNGQKPIWLNKLVVSRNRLQLRVRKFFGHD